MTKRLPPLQCHLCGKEIERLSSGHKFCDSCRLVHKRQKVRIWQKNNPEKHSQNRKTTSRRIKERGLTINRSVSRKSLFDFNNFSFDKGWRISFDFPYSQIASKNQSWKMNKKGHVYKTKELNQYQNALAFKVKSLLIGHKVYKNKVWIELFVQKPSHKSDAINVLDTICDGIKIGMGVDDKWFSIKQLDWEITKTEPKIFISIYQLDLFDAASCGSCGRILSLESFTTSPNVTQSICENCRYANKPHEKGGHHGRYEDDWRIRTSRKEADC